MERLGLHSMRERHKERVSKHTKNSIRNNTQSVHCVCLMNTFIQVLFGLTEVLTVLQCSFMSPYTNSQIYSLWNIFPTASRFLHRTGLPTHRSAFRFMYSASPIGPNRSGPRLAQPTRPMLSLSLNTKERLQVTLSISYFLCFLSS